MVYISLKEKETSHKCVQIYSNIIDHENKTCLFIILTAIHDLITAVVILTTFCCVPVTDDLITSDNCIQDVLQMYCIKKLSRLWL